MMDSISDKASKMVDRYIAQATKKLFRVPAELTLEELTRNSTLIYSIIYHKRLFDAGDKPHLKR